MNHGPWSIYKHKIVIDLQLGCLGMQEKWIRRFTCGKRELKVDRRKLLWLLEEKCMLEVGVDEKGWFGVRWWDCSINVLHSLAYLDSRTISVNVSVPFSLTHTQRQLEYRHAGNAFDTSFHSEFGGNIGYLKIMVFFFHQISLKSYLKF